MRILIVFLLALIGFGAVSGAVPLGHADFVPSDERPVNWRGDGTGAWTGATPVRHFDATQGTNIVWRTAMPSPGMNVPIVVGEKVFCLADPNLLVCCNVHTGEILWQTAIDHTLQMPTDQRAQARELIAWYEDEMLQYGRFRDELGTLVKELQAKGFDSKELLSKKDSLEDISSSEKWQTLPQDLQQRYLACKEAAATNGYRSGSGGNSKQLDIKHPKWRDRLQTLLDEFSYHTANNWYGFVTKTYASPCSDGTYIYVQTSQHAVAAVDLDGTIAWLTWDPPDPKVYDQGQTKMHTRFVLSPILYKDSFIVRADTRLLCYDKRTGKKKWEHYPGGQKGLARSKNKRGTYSLSCRQHPEAAHHCAFAIPLEGGGELDVVMDPAGQLLRLDDGKVLRDDLPWCIEVASPIGLPGKWYASSYYASWRDSPGPGKEMVKGKGRKGMFLFAFSAKDRDLVSHELLWHVPGDAIVLADGKLYGDRDAGRYDLATGQRDDGFKYRLIGKYTWTSMGGSLLVRGGDGSKDAPASHVPYAMVDVVDGSRSEGLLIDDRIDTDPEWRIRWRYRGSMDFKNTHGPMFQANRMFVRTMGYLHCVGDPAQAFPVPAQCPANARLR